MKPPAGIGQWTPEDVNSGRWVSIADMTEWAVKFSTIGYAREAYKEHYWVPENANPFLPRNWKPLNGLEYKSRIADQFRIVCASDRQLVTECDLEGQYAEFYILVDYQSVNANNNDNNNDLISDLKTFAAAVDNQMEKYLGYQK